jgi:CRISPR-associated protein Cas6
MPSGQLYTDAHRVIDCAFPLQGDVIPVDHGYALYSAVSRLPGPGPWLHATDQAAIHPIRGRYMGDGLLALTKTSRLTLRLAAADLPTVLALAGQAIDIDGRRMRIGVPQTSLLRPAATLYAHRVTTRNGQDEERFDAEIRRQLEALDVCAAVTRGSRRVLRIKDKMVVAHALVVTGLDGDDSVRLQQVGLGGRRKMGCGVLVTAEARDDN